MSLNNGSLSSQLKDPDRPFSLCELLDLEFRAPDMEQADDFFRTAGCSSSYLIGAADRRFARSYEWCVEGMKYGCADVPDGLMAQTNHFVNEEWGFGIPSDEESWYSVTRRRNLIALAEKNKGRIDAGMMKKFMALGIEDGGPMDDLTVYQIIAVPAELTLWIRVVGGADWTRFDLSEYFR